MSAAAVCPHPPGSQLAAAWAIRPGVGVRVTAFRGGDRLGHPYGVLAVFGDGAAFVIGRNHHLPFRFEPYAVPVRVVSNGRPAPWDGWVLADSDGGAA